MHPQGIRKLHCLPYKYKMQGVLNKYFAMLLKDFDNNVTVLKHCMNSLLLHNVPWKFKLSWPENWYLLSLLESWHLRNETKISNHKCKKRQRTKTTQKKKIKKNPQIHMLLFCVQIWFLESRGQFFKGACFSSGTFNSLVFHLDLGWVQSENYLN